MPPQDLPPIAFKRWENNTDLPLPTYASEGAAGFDLRACLPGGAVALAPGERRLISTGFAVAVPKGYEMQVRPRSGLAAKYGIGVVNSPGTVDCDYRGLVMVCLINLGHEPFVVNHAERIAQAVIAPAPQFPLIEVAELDETERGAGGFGSTGVK